MTLHIPHPVEVGSQELTAASIRRELIDMCANEEGTGEILKAYLLIILGLDKTTVRSFLVGRPDYVYDVMLSLVRRKDADAERQKAFWLKVAEVARVVLNDQEIELLTCATFAEDQHVFEQMHEFGDRHPAIDPFVRFGWHVHVHG